MSGTIQCNQSFSPTRNPPSNSPTRKIFPFSIHFHPIIPACLIHFEKGINRAFSLGAGPSFL